MERKVIFLDIDGTLTEPGSNEPPKSALKAIEGARKKGNYVFLCTGRNYDMLLPLLKYDFDGVVASSGGYIRYGDQIIYDNPMTEAQKETSMRLLQKNGIYRTVECVEGAYTDEGFKEFLQQNATEGSNSEMLRWRRQIEESLRIRPMSEYEGQPVYKIVFMCQNEKQLEEPIRELGDEFDICIQDTNCYGYVNGEMISKDYDKGKGVRCVCDALGVPIENSVAFGDSMNDKEMMETAGLAICMANGSPRLKELADDICPAVTEDGLWHAFEKYHLM